MLGEKPPVTDIAVNTHLLTFAFIMLGTLVLVIIGWRYLDKRLTAQGEREVDESFHQDVSGRPRQPWDGEAWPHQVRDYQNDPWVHSQPPHVPQLLTAADTQVELWSPRFIPTQVLPAVTAQARPACPASGPLPGLDASLETDAFIASMRAETDRWISYYSMAELAGV